ncbi:MAG: DinB family protein, partial [Actinomycetota bacterium]|nr:DinB family protein [Actinomycetota bacterium]
MSSTELPWEPPLAGSEAEHLFGALDRLRTTFRWKADGLDDRGLRVSVGASELTMGSLLKHLAFVEAFYAQLKLAGRSPGAPWETVDWEANPGWDFASAGADSAE